MSLMGKNVIRKKNENPIDIVCQALYVYIFFIYNFL